MATLEDKTILIIGGTSGIGFAVAVGALKSLASRVIVLSSTASKVDSAVTRLGAVISSANPPLPGKVEGITLDAANLPELAKTVEELGEIDHLVWTSGRVPKMDTFKESVVEEKKVFLDLRLWAPIQAVKSANIKKGGSVILTGGAATDKPLQNWSYAAAVGASLEGLTRGLAVDLAPIRVNLVSPGAVLTELWDGFPPGFKEHFLKATEEKLLVKHVANPDEVAEAYLFLMKCSFITGEIVHVNGGAYLV